MTNILQGNVVDFDDDFNGIVVLDDGHIDAVGSHEELLRTSAIYREVYESQQKGGEDDA